MQERKQVLSEESRSRRRFLKQAGTVAWATPFIVTMMSRHAHAQVGCGSVGVNPSVCEVTKPCGSTERCVPDITELDGSCICAPLPTP